MISRCLPRKTESELEFSVPIELLTLLAQKLFWICKEACCSVCLLSKKQLAMCLTVWNTCQNCHFKCGIPRIFRRISIPRDLPS